MAAFGVLGRKARREAPQTGKHRHILVVRGGEVTTRAGHEVGNQVRWTLNGDEGMDQGWESPGIGAAKRRRPVSVFLLMKECW